MSTPLFHYLLIHWLIAFIPIGLGIFVISKDHKNPLYQAFLRYNFVISWWGLFNLFMEYSKNEQQALFWDRISLLGIVYIPAMFLHFTWMYSGKSKFYKLGIRLAYFLSTFFFMFVFTPWMAKSATPKYIIPYFTDPGFLYHFYVVYFISAMTLGNILVLKAYLTADTRQRKTGTRLFLIATSLSTIGGGGNFMVPYKIYTPILYPYGGYTFILYGLLITYTILRYRFLDIEVIIKKTIVFAGIVTAAVSIVALPFALIQAIIGKALGLPNPFILVTLAVATAALIYRPVERVLVDLTDRYLFQKKFDYRKLLKEASQEMAAIKSLKQLSRLIVSFLVLKGRISQVATYVFDDQNSMFLLQAARPKLADSHIKLDHHNLLISYLKKKRSSIEKTQLEIELTQCAPEEKYELQSLLTLFKEMNIEAVVPSFLSRSREMDGKAEPELRSILLLGSKKSDEPYSPEDLDIFFTLAQESAIAIENARLYDEGIQKTREVMDLKLQLAAKEKKQLLGNMAGGIAHEIRGPIQLIQLSLERIKMALKKKYDKLLDDSTNVEEKKKLSAELFEDISKYLKQIHESNDRQLTTTTTIERFIKIEDIDLDQLDADKISEQAFEKERIDVFMAVKLIVEEAKIRYDRRDNYAVEIDTSAVGSRIPHMKANQNLLKQVLINLLLNAYDAMRGREIKKISIDSYLDPVDSDFIQIEIKDTGSGIPDELKEKIWEPWFSTKSKERGSGIGLYICRVIIDKIHGGRIWFESTPGVGTTFHLKIPSWK